MSMSYYLGKIPSEFVGRIHYSELRNGYYYGTTRIADSWASSDEIREKAREHLYRRELENVRDRNEYLVWEKKSLVQTRIKNAQSNKKLFAETQQATKQKIDGLNQSSLFKKQREQIIQKFNHTVAGVEQKLQEDEKKYRAQLSRIEELEKEAAATASVDKLDEINDELDAIRLGSPTDVPTRELTKISMAVEKVSEIFDALEECFNKLNKIDKSVSEFYLKKVEKLINDLDPFSHSFADVEKEIERVITQVTEELKDLAAKKEYAQESKALMQAVNELEAAKSSFMSQQNVDHITNYQTYRPSIDEVIEEFDQINSTEILEKYNSILESIDRLDASNKTKDSYERLVALRKELADLKEENRIYNDKKNNFDATLNRINKQICELNNRELVKMTFDVNHYEEQLKELEEIERLNIVFMKSKYFMEKVNETKKHYEDIGMIELPFEERLENNDEDEKEHYARLVFIDKDHPEVVTVVYILKTGEQITMTMPVIYQIGGRKYYAEDSEELRKVIGQTCKKGLAEGATEEVVTSDNIQYYVFSEEASRTINGEFHMIDEARGTSRRITSTSVKEGNGEALRTASDKERILEMKIKP